MPPAQSSPPITVNTQPSGHSPAALVVVVAQSQVVVVVVEQTGGELSFVEQPVNVHCPASVGQKVGQRQSHGPVVVVLVACGRCCGGGWLAIVVLVVVVDVTIGPHQASRVVEVLFEVDVVVWLVVVVQVVETPQPLETRDHARPPDTAIASNLHVPSHFGWAVVVVVTLSGDV